MSSFPPFVSVQNQGNNDNLPSSCTDPKTCSVFPPLFISHCHHGSTDQAPTSSEITTSTEAPPSPEGDRQQDQPGQAVTASTAASTPSPSTLIEQVPTVAPTAQANPSSSTTAVEHRTNALPPALNSYISSSTRQTRRLTLRNADTPEVTVPQLPPVTTSSGGDLSTAAAVALQSSSLPPPPPPTPTTMATTRSRGRGRVMFEQLMALNSANAIIAAQTAGNQSEAEVGSRFGPNVDASNPSRPTTLSTSGPGTSVTADRVTNLEAQTQAEAVTEANPNPFPRPRTSDNVVLNLDRGASQTSSPPSLGAPTRSLRLRPLRMTGVSAAETEAGITTIVAQSEPRRRARNSALLGSGAQRPLETGSAASSTTGRLTRSASAASAAAAAGGRSENMPFNLGGNDSTRQQSAPYPRTQRPTRARSTQINNGGSHHVSEASFPTPPTSLSSKTTAVDAGAAVISINDGIADSASSTPTPSRGAAWAGTKRSRTEMESPGDNDVLQNAGHAGGAVSGSSSPVADHLNPDDEEDEVIESGVVQLIGGGGGTGGVTQTVGEEIAQVEDAPQSTEAGRAAQVGGPAFAVTRSTHPSTGVTTFTFLLAPGVDPNYPLGFGGVINVPQFASSADTAVGLSTSVTPPIGHSSLTSSSLSAVPPNSSSATTAFPGGIPAARTAVLQAARSMIESLGTTDATPIIPYATATTTIAAVTTAEHEAAVADEVALSSESNTEPVSPHHIDDAGNGGSTSDLDSPSSRRSSAGQDDGEGREKRRRVDDRDEESSNV